VRFFCLPLSLLPLAFFCAAAFAQAPSPHEIEIPSWFSETLLEFPEDVREAAREGKRMLVYFGQDGCPYCTRLMRDNFTQKDLVDLTRRHYVAVALNIWGDRKLQWTDGRVFTEKALALALRVQFTPTILLLDEKGAVAARLNGYYPPQRFAAALAWGAGTAGKGQRFDEYMATAAKDAASPTLHEAPFLRKGPAQLKGAKPVALLFETPYCAGCDELHKEGFSRPEVRQLLQRFDVYRGDAALARRLKVSYTPSLVLFDGGREAFRIEAYVRSFHLAGALDYVASGEYRRERSFQRFLQARAERLRERGAQVDLWN
jgi:thioredoxin-related protein